MLTDNLIAHLFNIEMKANWKKSFQRFRENEKIYLFGVISHSSNQQMSRTDPDQIGAEPEPEGGGFPLFWIALYED